ncbi:MAG: hypothetical protein M1816_007448 [Peltula sp. TS41687]|nr:MAG: hypothetical protein M1816_007448 [Peltula sp. TS41687]
MADYQPSSTTMGEPPSANPTDDQPSSSSSSASPHPISPRRLEAIAIQACRKTLQDVTEYDHSQCERWNTEIIHSILERLIEDASPKGAHKFIVNSTIVQHAPTAKGTTTTTTTGEGRRGMHSATAGYWNLQKDGMWNYKLEGKGQGKGRSGGEEDGLEGVGAGAGAGAGAGLDVVVSVIWVAIA